VQRVGSRNAGVAELAKALAATWSADPTADIEVIDLRDLLPDDPVREDVGKFSGPFQQCGNHKIHTFPFGSGVSGHVIIPLRPGTKLMRR
jgi:hypothetical protein